ncbi:TetR family transcriptional regulator, partial [Bacillus cereus]
REHQMYLAVIFQETIERGIQSGELEGNTDAKSLAQALIVALIGLTVMMKSRPQRSFVDNVIAATLTLLK